MIVERIRQIIDYLNVSERAFCRDNGLSNGYLDKVKTVGADKVERILTNNPWIDGTWLITGIGSMIKDKPAQTNSTEEPVAHYTPTIKASTGVPYYDIDFINGFDQALENKSIKPAFLIDFPPFNDADCWVNVSGKSMAPQISPGDLVALKKMDTWSDFLLFGEIYAIITEDCHTIKIIAAGHDQDHFTLVPHNEDGEFSRQPIPKKLIKQVFQVKGTIKKFF